MHQLIRVIIGHERRALVLLEMLEEGGSLSKDFVTSAACYILLRGVHLLHVRDTALKVLPRRRCINSMRHREPEKIAYLLRMTVPSGLTLEVNATDGTNDVHGTLHLVHM